MINKLFVIFILLVFAFVRSPSQVIIEQNTLEREYAPDSGKSTSDKHFKVGLFLPFFKEGADTTPVKHAFALASIDYLAGVKVAIDSIEKVGNVNIDLYVEDTELDSSIVEYLLNKEIYHDLDVLIGPNFQSGVDMAAPIIQKRNTIMYMPFEKDFRFSNLSNIISSQKNIPAFAAYFTAFFLNNFTGMDKEFVLFYNSKEGKYGREARDMDSLIKLDLSASIDTSALRIIDLAKKEDSNPAAKLSKTKKYVFFINTKSSYYANDALSRINLLNSDSPEVFCFFEILESEIPSYEKWDSLNVKFFSKFFVNYEDGATGLLRKKIIESYNQDPVEFTYKGYNDLLFLSEVFTEGKHWLKRGLNKSFANEVSGFYYFKDMATDGIFNGYHGVWRYEKLKLYRVN